MKKSHIIVLIIIAASAAVVFFSLNNSETYASFREASAKPNKVFHVVGKLDRNREISYNPSVDPNLMSFYITDKEGSEHKVVLHKAKPQDFDKSEQIVVIGKMKGDEFHARDILTKCPSKYADAPTQQVN